MKRHLLSHDKAIRQLCYIQSAESGPFSDGRGRLTPPTPPLGYGPVDQDDYPSVLSAP